MAPETPVQLALELPEHQALALAQFMKRVGWSEWRANAVDDDEARVMRAACEALREVLAAAGFAPRWPAMPDIGKD